jgi:two-component system response regulator RegA
VSPRATDLVGDTAAATARAQRRILLVDDETSILFAVSDYMNARGFTVDCARDLDEAIALLGRCAYAVVIADLRLGATGDEGGLEFIDQVRHRCPSARTVLLTAYGSPAIELEARRRRVDAVLLKPQPLSEIARIVDGLLSHDR